LNIEWADNSESMAERAAILFGEVLRAAVAERGVAYVALSGGKTPKPLYDRLGIDAEAREVPWGEVHVFFGDERVVPSDSPNSNYHMVETILLDRVPIPSENVHRVPTELGPQGAATSYDSALRDVAATQGRDMPRFDLMLLGIGPDGHTASLFPGTDALSDTTHLAVAVHLPTESVGARDGPDRVTVTYPVINASAEIIFLVAGDDKADVLRQIEAGDHQLPAARVRPIHGEVRWLVVKPPDSR
jgi:6-phosphogluconolactonase